MVMLTSKRDACEREQSRYEMRPNPDLWWSIRKKICAHEKAGCQIKKFKTKLSHFISGVQHWQCKGEETESLNYARHTIIQDNTGSAVSTVNTNDSVNIVNTVSNRYSGSIVWSGGLQLLLPEIRSQQIPGNEGVKPKKLTSLHQFPSPQKPN